MSLKGEVAENWEEFERAWNDYCIATVLDKKSKTEEGADDPAGQLVVAATLCSVMGTECRKILNNLPEVTEETRKNLIQSLKPFVHIFCHSVMYCMSVFYLTRLYKKLEKRLTSLCFGFVSLLTLVSLIP